MKRLIVIGLFLVTIIGFAFGSTTISKNADTIPPNPMGTSVLVN